MTSAREALDATSGWLARCHRAFMPGYTAQVTLWWWLLVLVGYGVIGYATGTLANSSGEVAWAHIVGATCLAMLAGLVPVRTPGSTNAFTAGEIFLFLLLLGHGAPAATLAAAAEAAVASCRASTRWTSRIASPAMSATAMFVAGTVFEVAANGLSLAGIVHDGYLLLCSMLLALVYFVVNTVLITTIPRLKSGERLHLPSLFRSYGWLLLTYLGSASVATFLFLSYQQSGIVIVIAALPVIAILLGTGHFFFRREEAGEAVRLAEAGKLEQTARHVVQLEASERRFHSAFTHASIGMALVAFDGRVRQANRALGLLLGISESELDAARLDFTDFVSGDGSKTLASELTRVQSGLVDSLSLELKAHHRNGHDVWVAAHCAFFSEPESSEPWLILQLQDITARRHAQAELRHIAFHDSLTGLPNRHRFHEHLAWAIRRIRMDPEQDFGVMFLDLDRFKLINDSMGHPIGDEFLVQVARRIEASLSHGDVVARLGGDEFAVLATGRASEGFALSLADRLLVAMQQPFAVGGIDITTSASIGITFGALGYDTPQDVLRDADIAMYKAKAAGKARYAVFDASLHTEVTQRLRLEGDLRRALAAGELCVAYQPLFSLADGELIGFEALARWNHPQLGSIGPSLFIAIAEESGAIVQLTDFVLHRACHDLQRWRAAAPEHAALTMHVNIAAHDLGGSTFVDRVGRALAEAGLAPDALTIELTENILMERLEAAMDKLDDLHRLGVGLSVDDFGTGYSSLSHLSSLPIDSLKIDMSFVRNLRVDSKEAAVIRAIILLGRSLGKQVIAEGIETAAQLEQLRAMDCEVGQGYFLARPIEDVDGYLLERRRAGRGRMRDGAAVLLNA